MNYRFYVGNENNKKKKYREYGLVSLEPNWMPVDSKLKTLQTIEFDSTARNDTSVCDVLFVFVLSVSEMISSTNVRNEWNRKGENQFDHL